ncbi:MAG: alkaline phosphatase family protein [Burkholderiales bacterium]
MSALVAACGGAPVLPAPGPTHGETLAAAPPAGPELKPAAQWVSGGAGGGSFLLTKRPKLVVVIAIDQFRADYLTKFDPYFGATGFRRLLSRGATWTGHYGHYATYTGPGHALLLSGSYPYVNGIGANKFYNAETSRSEAMVFDGSAQILGMAKTDPDMDVSPKNFLGSTVGDELSLATGGQSKTISLATKGRGAILLGGRLGKTYFINDDTGEMTTSSYYMRELPAWTLAWNKKKLADSYFGKKWERVLPPEAYAISVPDDAKAEADSKGLGKVFPHVVNGKLSAPGPDFYEAFTHTPFANDYELDFAKAAVDGEKLGGRGVTDLLAISLSAIDLAGHDFGPFSQEVQDLVVRTDRQLGDFFEWLYGKFASDEVVVLLSADHGATPVPEQMAAIGFDAGRIKKKAIKEAIDGALTKRFGAAGGDGWVVAMEDPHVFLNRKVMAEKKLDAKEVERVAGEAAMTLKGFAGFLTRTQLMTGVVPPTDLARSLVRSYHVPRGGDVLMWTQPFYFWGKYGEKDQGSTHGTWYRYDSEVPVILVGPGVRPGRYGMREMVDVAPTLSYLLGLTAPAGSEGDVLPVLKGD